jgi:hypothetical protein
MTATALLTKFRKSADKNPEAFRSYYGFAPITCETGDSDANLEFRTALTEALLTGFSIDDIALNQGFI